MQKKTRERPDWIVGIDEVGRGPLAGPVTVCAVGMAYAKYRKLRWSGLTDSKQLSVIQREVWEQKARAMEELGVLRIALASQTAASIDRKGISACIRTCIGDILSELNCDPRKTLVLLDGGLRAPADYVFQETIIRGDQREKIISLASVVAKVARDTHMKKLAKKYPHFGWESNKGYGTKAHIIRIKKYGLNTKHRKSYLKKILDNIV